MPNTNLQQIETALVNAIRRRGHEVRYADGHQIARILFLPRARTFAENFEFEEIDLTVMARDMERELS